MAHPNRNDRAFEVWRPALTVTIVPARIGWRVTEEYEYLHPSSRWTLTRRRAGRVACEIMGAAVLDGYRTMA